MTPDEAVRHAARALAEVCATLPDLKLEIGGEPAPFEPDGVTMGSCISLTQSGGSWVLAMVADERTGAVMTRTLFGMEPDEHPGKEEHADALGEITNMTAGVVKRTVTEIDDQPITIGLPLFLSGTDALVYVGKGIRLLAQRLVGPGDLHAQVVLFWQG